MRIVIVTALILCIIASAKEEPVTYGSALRLQHKQTRFFLHSHGVSYGSGSRQQSVTCFPNNDDVNSFWTVMPAHGTKPQPRGSMVKCGSRIRLMHLNTRKLLHSHDYKSPLSSQMEVSCFGDNGVGDQGDDFILLCEPSQSQWLRNHQIKLKHAASGKFLHSHTHSYGHPISGQHEVTCNSPTDDNDYWVAMSGVFFTDVDPDADDDLFDNDEADVFDEL